MMRSVEDANKVFLQVDKSIVGELFRSLRNVEDYLGLFMVVFNNTMPDDKVGMVERGKKPIKIFDFSILYSMVKTTELY